MFDGVVNFYGPIIDEDIVGSVGVVLGGSGHAEIYFYIFLFLLCFSFTENSILH